MKRDFKNTNSEKMMFGGPRGKRFAEIEYADDIKTTLKRILTYFAEEKKILFILFLIVTIGAVSGVLAPIFQSYAIDVIAKTKEGSLIDFVAIMVFLYFVYSISLFLNGYLSADLSRKVIKKMREELFGKIMELPIGYSDSHPYGDTMSRMTNDIDNISTTISQSIPRIFSGLMTLFATLAIMLWLCWELALLSSITIILSVLFTKFISERIRKYSKKRLFLLGKTNGIVEEMISGYRTVTAYNIQETAKENFSKTSDELEKTGIKAGIFGGLMGPVMNSIGNIGFVIIAVFGGYFALQGLISIGTISAFIVYSKQFSRPINEIASIYGQIQTAIAGAERVFVVLDEESEDMSGDLLEISDQYTVTFKDVNFSYVPDVSVIKNFSLTVPSGKKVAIVGATGSGKTTIVNLLMRFYDIDSGEISINDQNINEISKSSLRENIGIVLQDTFLFTDTILNNLKYSNENAKPQKIEKAVKASRLTEMINSLPEGYDTILTTSGSNISQGQRQLFSIARAFVSDPKILIFDEATSNVDTRTEKEIQNAMQEIMKNRTSIVIAHRLSTIKDADIIAVMDKGQIVETGTHDTLIKKKGKYYELYMTQYAGFAI